MPGEQILIVDDTPVNLKLTRILLANEGYQVLTAASAEDALQILSGSRPDAVLSDIQLPAMDGLELTRRIKENPETRDIVVIALTAFASKADEGKAREAGCDGYITKPIDTRTLGSRVRELLDRRFAAREAAAVEAPQRACVSHQEMETLRTRFLTEGLENLRRMLAELDGRFDAHDASATVHRWVGTGGLLGYPRISDAARELEALLGEKPLDNAALRDSLASLATVFAQPGK